VRISKGLFVGCAAMIGASVLIAPNPAWAKKCKSYDVVCKSKEAAKKAEEAAKKAAADAKARADAAARAAAEASRKAAAAAAAATAEAQRKAAQAAEAAQKLAEETTARAEAAAKAAAAAAAAEMEAAQKLANDAAAEVKKQTDAAAKATNAAARKLAEDAKKTAESAVRSAKKQGNSAKKGMTKFAKDAKKQSGKLAGQVRRGFNNAVNRFKRELSGNLISSRVCSELVEAGLNKKKLSRPLEMAMRQMIGSKRKSGSGRNKASASEQAKFKKKFAGSIGAGTPFDDVFGKYAKNSKQKLAAFTKTLNAKDLCGGKSAHYFFAKLRKAGLYPSSEELKKLALNGAHPIRFALHDAIFPPAAASTVGNKNAYGEFLGVALDLDIAALGGLTVGFEWIEHQAKTGDVRDNAKATYFNWGYSYGAAISMDTAMTWMKYGCKMDASGQKCKPGQQQARVNWKSFPGNSRGLEISVNIGAGASYTTVYPMSKRNKRTTNPGLIMSEKPIGAGMGVGGGVGAGIYNSIWNHTYRISKWTKPRSNGNL